MRYLLALATFSTFLAGNCQETLTDEAAIQVQNPLPSPRVDAWNRPSIKAKAGYFMFASSEMREVYSQGGLDLQISGTYPIWKSLQGYASIEYLEKTGFSTSFHHKTELWQLPVNFGVRYVFPIVQKFQISSALGPRYYFIHVKNDSPYVSPTITRNGIGAFANVGFHYLPIPAFQIDTFAEFSYQPLRISDTAGNIYGNSVQVGGYTFGGSLGYAF